MRILCDIEQLAQPSEPVTYREGVRIANQLHIFLQDYNRKVTQAKKKLTKGKPLSRGIGLAAPQIGIFKRVCVLNASGKIHSFINPRITAWSENRFPITEGCLSLPGVQKSCYRHFWVDVESDTVAGKIVSRVFGAKDPTFATEKSLLESACIQHEIAHLAGLLIYDFQKMDSPTPDQWFESEAAAVDGQTR